MKVPNFFRDIKAAFKDDLAKWREGEETRKQESGLSSEVDPPFLALVWSMLFVGTGLSFYSSEKLISALLDYPSQSEAELVPRVIAWTIVNVTTTLYVLGNAYFGLRLLDQYTATKFDYGYGGFARSTRRVAISGLIALVLITVYSMGRIAKQAV